MKIVLDVSAAFAIITGTSGAEELTEQVKSASQVFSPELFYAEAANTAWKFHHIGDLNTKQVVEMTEMAVQLVDVFVSSEILWEKALSLACEISHSAYDCFYLVLARHQGAILLSLDKQLLKLAQQLNIPTATG